MFEGFENRLAVVTGASSGIGLATVDRLLASGGAAGASGGAVLKSEKDQELDARLAALKAKLDKRSSGE